MDIRPIETESDYRWALKRLEDLFEVPEDNLQQEEENILTLMIDEYEKAHFLIEIPDPIEAIIRMEEIMLQQVDILGAFGFKNRVPEMLVKKLLMSDETIRLINLKVHSFPDLLNRDYHLTR